ncbi:UDP-glucose 4-epimerase GalE [Roseibium sediminicola]|uniref:UDP-glucose 4-epimerase n=1 Tax=Roseibium sediminicola TaxID=2933272 RepID=A0ABT0H1M6_9HYPH|nr:UDP-glucose 4-epimerase GalE [Roseibium sp. CAU 1639]MCK7615590.1 UDP-glucose 4-epimerase GalE [Roseibium sp. CAU 1639]
MSILITGGAGYLGSHCCVSFLESGHEVVVFDNFSNSNPESLKRIEAITGKQPKFEHGDIRDQAALETALKRHDCEGVIHFAGLKVVGESLQDPLSYYDNNVIGTHRLLKALSTVGVHKLIFSSSANVYGEPRALPVTEDHSLNPGNPYGRTKLVVEDMLRDLSASDSRWRIGILRYFNPVGAHHSGLIGEDPLDVPNNLMPYFAQVATGRREHLSVFGNDYPTPDGTGMRDYIHVVDLVQGHLHAYEKLAELASPENCFCVNLGTGHGHSVLELVQAFERGANRPIPYQIVGRRAGDVAESYADTQKAKAFLSWSAERNLEDMCSDTWNWVRKNPLGYEPDANAED